MAVIRQRGVISILFEAHYELIHFDHLLALIAPYLVWKGKATECCPPWSHATFCLFWMILAEIWLVRHLNFNQMFPENESDNLEKRERLFAFLQASPVFFYDFVAVSWFCQKLQFLTPSRKASLLSIPSDLLEFSCHIPSTREWTTWPWDDLFCWLNGQLVTWFPMAILSFHKLSNQFITFITYNIFNNHMVYFTNIHPDDQERFQLQCETSQESTQREKEMAAILEENVQRTAPQENRGFSPANFSNWKKCGLEGYDIANHHMWKINNLVL